MTARALAIARIARAAHRFPDIHFRLGEQTPDAALEALDARDAALAGAIEHHVLRRWLTLAAVIESQLSRPWHETENRLQAALLCGAAQLLLMDRVPDYAVIDETVEWAKGNIRPKAGGLVNAVLRKVAALRGEHMAPVDGVASLQPADALPLHDGRCLRLNAAAFADDPMRRLGQHTSHPLELLEHWIGLFGVERARMLATHDLVHAPIILHGLDDAAAAAAGLLPHRQTGFHVLDPQGHAALPDLLRAHPGLIVQDPSAAAAVAATRAVEPAPALIIDCCAGRGTKTRQLALAHPAAEIVATDVDKDRLRSLREAFSRHDRVRVVEHSRLLEFTGKADLVLLDVPCSNSGVLARRVEAKYRCNAASLRSLVDIQRQIVADALRLPSERGWIAYATCSVDPAENQQQAAWLAHWHPFQIVAQESREPAGSPGEDAAAYSDGGYWALLRRTR